MDAFHSATSLDRSADDRFAWTVPDGWQQGRGAWGGLVVGAMVGAVTRAEPDPARRVRSVSVQMAGPALVGTLDICVAQERGGSATSTWSARLTDSDRRVVATLSAVLGAARATGAELGDTNWGTVVAPPAPPADQVPVIAFGPPQGPAFAEHLEARPLSGRPASGGRASTAGWIRYAEPTALTAAALLALVDAWWPASLAALTRARPLATVSFAANLLIDPATVGVGEPFLHEAFVSAAADGFSSEQRRLWTIDGRLAVDNLQTVVVIA